MLCSIIVLNHSVFHLDWIWKYMYFKLNNTIILYKPRKVFNIPQKMSTFVDFTEYFDLRSKQQAYLTRGQQCVWFIKSDCAYWNTRSMEVISL